jgi:hypothetical protein
MTWGAVAVAGVGLVGGIMSSNASKSAANQQSQAGMYAANQQLQATRESNAMTMGMYNQGLANQSPYLQGGQTAYSALLGGMGLGAPTAAGGSGASNQPQGMYTNAYGQRVDALGNPISESNTPITNYGASQDELNAANGQFANQFTKTFAPSDLTTDPSFQWRLDQGLRAMKGQQSGRGLLGSSQSMTDLNNYAQGAASQEYQSAYNRFMQNQETAWGRLSGLAGIGSQTAGNIANQGQAAASQYGNNLMAGTSAANNYQTGAAAAGAAGTVGSANAIASGMNTGINNWMGYQYLNSKNPTGINSNKITSADVAAWKD